MKKLTSFSRLATLGAALLGTAASASATVIYSQTSSFPTTGTATQTGRLVRNGIPQDFSGTEAYPGTNNPTITFNFITLTLSPAQLAGNPDVQIELDTQGLGLFASAYANAYNPPSATNTAGSLQTNWLGDQGSSGDYAFGNTPSGTPDVSFFGVTVPTGSSLVIVLATAGAASGTTGTGTGTNYTLTVEDFSSTTYNAVVPEPSSLAALGAGILGVGFAVRRSFARSVAA